MHNPDFNVTEFSNIKNEAGSNGFVLSSKQWIEKPNAKEIFRKQAGMMVLSLAVAMAYPRYTFPFLAVYGLFLQKIHSI